MQQTVIADTRHRPACLLTQCLRPFHILLTEFRADILHQFLRLDLRHHQVEDALDTKRQSEDKSQCHQRHKACITINKLPLQLLVETAVLFIGILTATQESLVIDGHRQRRVLGGRVGCDDNGGVLRWSH